MLSYALICAGVVAAVHAYIFYLELPVYGSATFRRVFRLNEEQCAAMRPAFNNLAVYNAAIAVAATLGALLHVNAGSYRQGIADGLLLAALGTAAAAGIYLAATSPDKRRAALIQAAPAVLGLLCLFGAEVGK